MAVAGVTAILADQLTLSQSEGADYAHQITTGTLVRPSYSPGITRSWIETIQMNDLLNITLQIPFGALIFFLNKQ